MSWTMCINIYVKKNDVWSATDIVDKDFDILKALCEYRGSLSNDMSPASLNSSDFEALERLRKKQQIEDFDVSGYYYDYSSFVDFKNSMLRKFKELIVKKSQFVALKESLEYLKLSSEEKQNVLEEEDLLNEELTEVESKVEALTSMLAVLELFTEYDVSAVAFIYSV